MQEYLYEWCIWIKEWLIEKSVKSHKPSLSGATTEMIALIPPTLCKYTRSGPVSSRSRVRKKIIRVVHATELTEEEEYKVQARRVVGPQRVHQQDKQTSRHDLPPCGPSPTQRGDGSSHRLTCTEFLARSWVVDPSKTSCVHSIYRNNSIDFVYKYIYIYDKWTSILH